MKDVNTKERLNFPFLKPDTNLENSTLEKLANVNSDKLNDGIRSLKQANSVFARRFHCRRRVVDAKAPHSM